MIHNYYISSIDTIFDFGKHEGELFCDVIYEDPNYITWCALNIPEFAIHPDVLKKIIEFDSSIILPKSLTRKIGQPVDFFVYRNNKDDYDYDDDDDYEWVNNKYIYSESPTYERYNGSYAQDEMGYSDDDIDTIFDGDPLAYWNID